MAKKSQPKPSTTTRHRDAGSREYVTKQHADNNPKTTVKETDKKKK